MESVRTPVLKNHRRRSEGLTVESVAGMDHDARVEIRPPDDEKRRMNRISRSEKAAENKAAETLSWW